ncbi:hypothetical protein PR048_022979 [Dryococelus australis]|uniref:Uncharacterized protein n=1 Tax=Dryococelus australis TaxID=614101 RepID=A0ABQ9GSV7_9NEOP|nr:hypothetical protein PR048_022979 [Dryococelus australis]
MQEAGLTFPLRTASRWPIQRWTPSQREALARPSPPAGATGLVCLVTIGCKPYFPGSSRRKGPTGRGPESAPAMRQAHLFQFSCCTTPISVGVSPRTYHSHCLRLDHLRGRHDGEVGYVDEQVADRDQRDADYDGARQVPEETEKERALLLFQLLPILPTYLRSLGAEPSRTGAPTSVLPLLKTGHEEFSGAVHWQHEHHELTWRKEDLHLFCVTHACRLPPHGPIAPRAKYVPYRSLGSVYKPAGLGFLTDAAPLPSTMRPRAEQSRQTGCINVTRQGQQATSFAAGGGGSGHSHRWVLDLLRHIVEVVPAVVGPEARVEGGRHVAQRRCGALERALQVLRVPCNNTTRPPLRHSLLLSHLTRRGVLLIATTTPRFTTFDCFPSNSTIKYNTDTILCYSIMGKHYNGGTTVAERLTRSPPTKTNRAQSPAGSPDFCKWASCRTMPLVGGFSRGSPASSAPSFRHRSMITSITLIRSQDLAVKSCPNLFTHYNGNTLWVYTNQVRARGPPEGRCGIWPRDVARTEFKGEKYGSTPRKATGHRKRPLRLTYAKTRGPNPARRVRRPAIQRYDGNTARLARRSDEALDVRVSVARIAPSLLDLGRAAT